jgi:hypothetical protein
MSAGSGAWPVANANGWRARVVSARGDSNKNPGYSQGFRASRHGEYRLSPVPARPGLHARDPLVLHLFVGVSASLDNAGARTGYQTLE